MQNLESAIWYNRGVEITSHNRKATHLMTHTITQLPTSKDRVRMIATTKEKYIHGPGTILLSEYDDGCMHQEEFDYMPDATVKSLIAFANEQNRKNG